MLDDPVRLLPISPSHLSFSLPTPPPPKPLPGLAGEGGRGRWTSSPYLHHSVQRRERRRVICLSLQFETWDPWGGQHVP